MAAIHPSAAPAAAIIQGSLMSPVAVVLFMTGIISLIVGAVRAMSAIRAGTLSRPSLPAGAWLAMSLYGLILASAGIIIGR